MLCIDRWTRPAPSAQILGVELVHGDDFEHQFADVRQDLRLLLAEDGFIERILQLLSATHLSQREMARELGISFNTIKSHVKSIYVKLGATSRDEASQIARSSGLL